MKHLLLLLLLSFLSVAHTRTAQANDGPKLPPYLDMGTLSASMDNASAQITEALKNGGFEILGSYDPENSANLRVIAFTRSDLKQAALQAEDRGGLAAVLKVGLVRKGDAVNVSLVNPPYLFNAYLRKEAPKHEKVLERVEADLERVLAVAGHEPVGFGGGVEARKLWEYKYMIAMPKFKDPEELRTYSSFEEGLRTIEANLANNGVQAREVYRLVVPEAKTAVFGVALLDKEIGEPHFLPIIGEENIAAMPYEIILQGDTATMLHGKYRLALSWPELSLGRFMKISGTPGDIRDMLRAVTGR